MSDAVFDIKITEQHRTARFVFVPWLVRLFSEGPLRSDTSEIPEGDENALTDETVDAIKQICNRAVWQFLAKQCGWKKIDSLHSEDQDSHSFQRLWSNHQSLAFSTATPNLLIAMFNATRRSGGFDRITLPNCLKHNGDLLVHHLVFRRLRDAPLAFGHPPEQSLDRWFANPLNAMYDPLGYRNYDPALTQWIRLCEPDFAAFVPWLGLRQVEKWKQDSAVHRADGLEARLTWLEALTFLVADWGVIAEKCGRIDLAGFVLDLMMHHQQRSEINLTEFRRETAQLSLRQRQEMTGSWTDFLALTGPLEESAKQCLNAHPVERTGPQKCFLAKWEALDFSATVSRLQELSQNLRPTLG